MPPKRSQGSPELGEAIKARRESLGLTIEEAARKAGVGTKTWSRYESGASIRSDKVPKVLKVLDWKELPNDETIVEDDPLSGIDESHKAWSTYLYNTYGRITAASFALGSDIVLDHAKEDLAELSTRPKGTHLGELGFSWLAGDLPPQFLTRYDYEFMYALVFFIKRLRAQAKNGECIVAHTVMEEIILSLIESEANATFELFGVDYDLLDECPEGLVGEITDDNDVEFVLFSGMALVHPGHTYYFDEWTKEQFYLDRPTNDLP